MPLARISAQPASGSGPSVSPNSVQPKITTATGSQ